MKKKQSLAVCTLEELNAKRRQTKVTLSGLVGISVVAIPILLYGAYTESNIAFLVIGIVNLLTISGLLIKFFQINKKIKSRYSPTIERE